MAITGNIMMNGGLVVVFWTEPTSVYLLGNMVSPRIHLTSNSLVFFLTTMENRSPSSFFSCWNDLSCRCVLFLAHFICEEGSTEANNARWMLGWHTYCSPPPSNSEQLLFWESNGDFSDKNTMQVEANLFWFQSPSFSEYTSLPWTA